MVVFICLVIGVWFYTSSILERQGRLLSEVVPELDTAYQLSAGAALLQSQSLLLPLSENVQELQERRELLDQAIMQTWVILQQSDTVTHTDYNSLRQLTEEFENQVARLQSYRTDELRLQKLVARQRVSIGRQLLRFEDFIRNRIVDLTDLFLDGSVSLSGELALGSRGEGAAERSETLLLDLESNALLVQDFELLNQDLVSLQALVERIPLLLSVNELVIAEQTRDLLIKQMLNRAVYLDDNQSEQRLLSNVTALRLQLRSESGMLQNQRRFLSVRKRLDDVRVELTDLTQDILMQSQSIKSRANQSLALVSKDTTQGLIQYRQFLTIFALVTLSLLAVIGYRLLYRNMAVPLTQITSRLRLVGSKEFSDQEKDYRIREMLNLSAAVSQLHGAQLSMKQQDRQLKSSNQELSRVNQDLRQFAHVASHDLQEPLRKIQQFSALLVDDYQPALKGDGLFYLDVISGSSERMRSLIRDTLEYSRAGMASQSIEEIDLIDIFDYLRKELDLLIEESGASLQLDDLPIVFANRTGLRQLFRNLITNAIKYARVGKNPVIKVSYQANIASHEFVLQVQDNGVGVDAAYADRIFMPFERLETTSVSGTGLGLAICRKVCEAHGWTLTLDSSAAQGSCFSIRGSLSAVARSYDKAL